ncbi:ATP synthase f1 [Mycena sanguinolenta]|uniref:ATP synthase f1 n=1 Tax=Mycena sanguinolenta TaxID=230812 RepID=A0A8H6Y7L3_9AGAR|nr:ATP synthase f1 [Mycena sanguinolenta]
MPSPRAATWTLDVPTTAHPAPETETVTDPNHGAESILGQDFRELVWPSDFQDGAKYRSIVKIQSRFRNYNGEDVWMMGTGWLIRPDLLVTAGHVVYDRAYNCGAATQIKCYIGYNGAQSVPQRGSAEGNIPAVQPRYGSKIVTTESWIKDNDARRRDVAFIRVHKPFVGNLNLFKFANTRSPGMQRIGVVGYPGDKDLNGEKGAQMYELFDSTPIDLEKHPRHMIAYHISTYGGQSGAPVLSKTPAGLVAIGTHCYGAGNGEAKNTGNAIGGEWGNDYNLLISLFDSTISTAPNNIEYVVPGSTVKPPVPSSRSSFPLRPPTPGLQSSYPPLPPTPGPQPPSRSGRTDPVFSPQPPVRLEVVEEGFLDMLKDVARIGATVVQAGGSMFGPIGTVVGTAAGGLLGALAGQESTMMALAMGRRDTNSIAPGVSERAVLAEASLQGVLNLMEHGDPNDPVINKIVSHMAHNYTYFAPNIDTLSSRLAPQLTECALDIASQRLNRALTEPHQEADFEPLPRRALTGVPSAEAGFDLGKQGAFAESLLGPTLPLRGGEEGAFDFLGSLLTKAVSVAGPLVSRAAKAVVTDVLPQVISRVVGSGPNSEATLSPVSPLNAEAANLIFKRALVADTAASALMSLSREELATLKIKRSAQESGAEQQEGIVDFIKTTVQKIGPFALSTAQSVVKRFAPVLIDVAANKLKEKIGPSLGSELAPRLKRQPSNLDKYRSSGVATESAFNATLAAASASPPVSSSHNFVPESRGGGLAGMGSRSANDLVFAARGSVLHPAGPPPISTAPWNPDQPPILTTPPPDFSP